MANLDDVYDIDHRTEAFEKHAQGVLVCLAGPGTGKTFSLLARSQALAARGASQDSICYLTFIREIAAAFIDDYVQRFGDEAYAASAPRISTLHSFACRLLRNQGFRLTYDGELYFSNLADSDAPASTFLGDVLPLLTCDGCRTIPQLRAWLESIKQAWQNDSDASALEGLAGALAPQVMEAGRCYRLLDWDQTIPLAIEILTALPDTPEWLSRIHHYFVDEYQDFNKAEQHLIALLADKAESLVIVGDDDQSLYSGRGGSPDGIRQLYANPDHDTVTLVKCYRCKSSIVRPTNAFQAHMANPARPMTPAAAGGEVTCLRFKSSKAEVAYLADFLIRKIDELPEHPRPKDGIVCLFPSKRILSAYFDMLSPCLPCTKRAGVHFDDRDLLQLILSLLVRRDQRFAQRLLLNQFPALKPRHRAAMFRQILDRDISPSAALELLVADGALNGAALAAAQEFIGLCHCLSARDLQSAGRAIAAKLNVEEGLVAAELDRLFTALEHERPELTDKVCDTLLPHSVPAPPDPRSVAFLTMHGSKGLTRRTVVLPAMEEACLPGAGDPAALPERKRLFFVALSRATDCLLITLPHNRGGDPLNFAMEGRGAVSSFIPAAGLAAAFHT